MKKIFFLLFYCFFSIHLGAETTHLKFWQFWSNEWIRPSIEAFEKENPNVKIDTERLTWGDGRNKIITALAANQAPDIIEIGSTWVAGLSSDGGLRELSPGGFLTRLSNWDAATYKKKYYAYPWTVSSGALYFNTDLMQRAGFSTPPQDWDELLKQSTAINALGKDIYGYGLKTGAYTTWQKFLPYVWSNSARLLLPDGKNTGLLSQEFIEAAQFYKKLKDVGLYDENVAVRSAFQKGGVGFMLEEPGQIETFKKETPDLNFSVGRLPNSPKGKSVNFSGAQMLAVTKNSKHPKEAETFIAFMVRHENAAQITHRITTLFPADKEGIKSDFYQKERPELLIFLKELQTATSPPAHPRWVEIQESFSEALERVMYEQATVKEAFEDADEEIKELLAEEF